MAAKPPKKLTAPANLMKLSEAAWQGLVTDTAATFGWHVTHFPQMVGNPRGYPDLVLMRGEDYLLVELKRENGVLSDGQTRWHMHAALFGITVHVWRPSDWPTVAKVLGVGHDVEVV